ncbi:MAG TPA: hypothetical protein VFU74_15225 [Actinocrinis sp.]|nr:hypothetical protein [Actinocrinis sp.]
MIAMPVEARADEVVCLCADCDARAAWRGCSDVLYLVDLVADSADIVRVLQAYPGAAVCAAMAERDRLLVAARWREHIHVLYSGADIVHSVNALPLFGSAVHASLAAGIEPWALTGVALVDEPTIRLRLREVRRAFEP